MGANLLESLIPWGTVRCNDEEFDDPAAPLCQYGFSAPSDGGTDNIGGAGAQRDASPNGAPGPVWDGSCNIPGKSPMRYELAASTVGWDGTNDEGAGAYGSMLTGYVVPPREPLAS